MAGSFVLPAEDLLAETEGMFWAAGQKYDYLWIDFLRCPCEHTCAFVCVCVRTCLTINVSATCKESITYLARHL